MDRKRDFENDAFWRSLHDECLKRLGFGTGSGVHRSGESFVARFLSSQLPKNATIFDVGANRGQYASILADAFPSATIYLFEPSPTTFKILLDNMREAENIRAHNLGVSDSDGQMTLFSDKCGSGMASLHQRRLDHFGISMDRRETVNVTSLDSFCRGNGVSTIDLLKLDVEGHELAVLRGAQGLLDANTIGAIQFEFGGCNIDSRTFFQDFFYLLSGRFRLYRVLPRGLVRVDRYRETDEVFVTTNYLALSSDRFAPFESKSLYGHTSNTATRSPSTRTR